MGQMKPAPKVVSVLKELQITKGSPLGDTLSLSCEASVGSSGSKLIAQFTPPLGIDFSIAPPPPLELISQYRPPPSPPQNQFSPGELLREPLMISG